MLGAGGTSDDRVGRLIRALAYVREVNGEGDDGMRIHGVNLSVGYEFDPEWFACGQSPLCKEVDKLVRSGVVVVVAAGNSGYGSLTTTLDAPTRFGLGMTINDPGNAERAITVGSTHRDAPHTYGVSYFSSKGPTGDGRRKPDLVAPGERITSCAAGGNLAAVEPAPPARRSGRLRRGQRAPAWPRRTSPARSPPSCRYGGSSSAGPTRSRRSSWTSATALGRGPDFEGSGLRRPDARTAIGLTNREGAHDDRRSRDCRSGS